MVIQKSINVFLVLFAVLTLVEPTASHGAMTENELINRAMSTSATNLDPSLPNQIFGAWFKQTLGPEWQFRFIVDRCIKDPIFEANRYGVLSPPQKGEDVCVKISGTESYDSGDMLMALHSVVVSVIVIDGKSGLLYQPKIKDVSFYRFTKLIQEYGADLSKINQALADFNIERKKHEEGSSKIKLLHFREEFLAGVALYGGIGLILIVNAFSFFRLKVKCQDNQLSKSEALQKYTLYSMGSLGGAVILVFAVSFIEFIISGYWFFGGEGSLTALFFIFIHLLVWLLFGSLFYFSLRFVIRSS